MEIKLSLPTITVRPTQRNVEMAIREVLTRNQDAFIQPLGGACTVRVLEDHRGVELSDGQRGIVRLVIGGRRDLIEEIPFSLDWGNRVLTAHVPDTA